jgi:hypothetical protein
LYLPPTNQIVAPLSLIVICRLLGVSFMWKGNSAEAEMLYSGFAEKRMKFDRSVGTAGLSLVACEAILLAKFWCVS